MRLSSRLCSAFNNYDFNDLSVFRIKSSDYSYELIILTIK